MDILDSGKDCSGRETVMREAEPRLCRGRECRSAFMPIVRVTLLRMSTSIIHCYAQPKKKTEEGEEADTALGTVIKTAFARVTAPTAPRVAGLGLDWPVSSS